jgi:hypothetical protein
VGVVSILDNFVQVQRKLLLGINLDATPLGATLSRV